MCGICGYVSSKNHDISILRRMNDRMVHRGPDAGSEKQWKFSETHQIGLGHRRLSVIDLSEAANQPLSTEDGLYTIIFNGEIYNYRELREELRKEGLHFNTEGDTEVILEGYRRWGVSVLDRLNGMFAFALYDRSKRELLLARDRIGIKPLYYWEIKNNIVFASTLA